MVSKLRAVCGDLLAIGGRRKDLAWHSRDRKGEKSISLHSPPFPPLFLKYVALEHQIEISIFKIVI